MVKLEKKFENLKRLEIILTEKTIQKYEKENKFYLKISNEAKINNKNITKLKAKISYILNRQINNIKIMDKPNKDTKSTFLILKIKKKLPVDTLKFVFTRKHVIDYLLN